VPFFRAAGHQGNRAEMLARLARALHALGDVARAVAHQQEALIVAQEVDHIGFRSARLAELARLYGANGQPERAVRLLGAAEAVRQANACQVEPHTRQLEERALTEARSALGEAEFAAAWAEGQAMPLQQAVRYALDQAGSA
jgi:tetratricopeptide (TPR) repeat protein